MFERFTEKAIKVIMLAQEEARRTSPKRFPIALPESYLDSKVSVVSTVSVGVINHVNSITKLTSFLKHLLKFD